MRAISDACWQRLLQELETRHAGPGSGRPPVRLHFHLQLKLGSAQCYSVEDMHGILDDVTSRGYGCTVYIYTDQLATGATWSPHMRDLLRQYPRHFLYITDLRKQMAWQTAEQAYHGYHANSEEVALRVHTLLQPDRVNYRQANPTMGQDQADAAIFSEAVDYLVFMQQQASVARDLEASAVKANVHQVLLCNGPLTAVAVDACAHAADMGQVAQSLIPLMVELSEQQAERQVSALNPITQRIVVKTVKKLYENKVPSDNIAEFVLDCAREAKKLEREKRLQVQLELEQSLTGPAIQSVSGLPSLTSASAVLEEDSASLDVAADMPLLATESDSSTMSTPASSGTPSPGRSTGKPSPEKGADDVEVAEADDSCATIRRTHSRRRLFIEGAGERAHEGEGAGSVVDHDQSKSASGRSSPVTLGFGK